jgi:hypothetical protein
VDTDPRPLDDDDAATELRLRYHARLPLLFPLKATKA